MYVLGFQCVCAVPHSGNPRDRDLPKNMKPMAERRFTYTHIHTYIHTYIIHTYIIPYIYLIDEYTYSVMNRQNVAQVLHTYIQIACDQISLHHILSYTYIHTYILGTSLRRPSVRPQVTARR